MMTHFQRQMSTGGGQATTKKESSDPEVSSSTTTLLLVFPISVPPTALLSTRQRPSAQDSHSSAVSTSQPKHCSSSLPSILAPCLPTRASSSSAAVRNCP